jgi:hypothetical protein
MLLLRAVGLQEDGISSQAEIVEVDGYQMGGFLFEIFRF